MTEPRISIAGDYSRYPGPRFKKLGADSGEDFRDGTLIPALKDGRRVAIQIDGTSGYPASFLEEAFGGLVRHGFSKTYLDSHLRIISEDPAYSSYKLLIKKYISDANDASNDPAFAA